MEKCCLFCNIQTIYQNLCTVLSQETSDKISIINTRNDSSQTFLDFNSNCDEYILLQKYSKTEDNSCKWA